MSQVAVEEGDTVPVGGLLFKITPGEGAPAPTPSEPEATQDDSTPPPPPPAPAPAAPATPATPAAKPAPPTPSPSPPSSSPAPVAGERGERRVRLSKMRRVIAQRLKDSQNTNAMLTTFNEVDMSSLFDIRKRHQEAFVKKHSTKLGFMSPFVAASAKALSESPEVNGVIDGDDVIYRDYVDVSVAVASPKGLVVPVIRNADTLSFAQIEASLAELAGKARDNTITVEEMSGGTFTISNGGVYGSLMGTPILNPPQSAILGMHGINKKPVVDANDNIVVKPMMYLALTYDHRLVDGREAVTFLRRIKDLIEDPVRLVIDV